MIALAVENAIADSVLHSTAGDTPAEEFCALGSDNDTITKGISSDMAVAIRQTVAGIIERTTENVLSQISAHTVKELVSQLVEATASQDELSGERVSGISS